MALTPERRLPEDKEPGAGPAAGSGDRDEIRVIHAARELNRLLLAKYPEGIFDGSALFGATVPDDLRSRLIPGVIWPAGRVTIYPVREETAAGLLALSRRWPNPMDPAVPSGEAFRAAAPGIVLDLIDTGTAAEDSSLLQAAGAEAVSVQSDSGPGTAGPAAPADRVAAPENLPGSLSEAAARAMEAFSGGEWHISARPWGTVSVDLSPEACKGLATLLGMIAAYGGRRFVGSLVAGRPWYMIVIWGLLTADTGYVSMVLSSCAANNRPARLYWNALTGILYATELPLDERIHVTIGGPEKSPAHSPGG